MNEEDFPFQKYLVGAHCQTAMLVNHVDEPVTQDPPKYLLQNHNNGLGEVLKSDIVNLSYNFVATKYDLSPIMKEECRKYGKDVQVLKKWPLQAMTNLDHSQFSAVKSALTKELALIQGPPGNIYRQTTKLIKNTFRASIFSLNIASISAFIFCAICLPLVESICP